MPLLARAHSPVLLRNFELQLGVASMKANNAKWNPAGYTEGRCAGVQIDC
jgi:hypothetical protein